MKAGGAKEKPVNVKFIMKTLFELQVAISKLAIAIFERERVHGPIPRPTAVRLAAMASGKPSSSFAAAGGPPIDEECGEAPIDEECGEAPIDEECGEARIPALCDPRAVELLCEHIEEIMAYLRALCTLARP